MMGHLRAGLLATAAALLGIHTEAASAQAATASGQSAEPAPARAATPTGQPAAEPATVDPARSDASGLEEIVVTAQKRSENLQSVPIAVDAFSSKALEAGQIKTVDQLVSLTPGLNINHSSNGAQPFIRGIGTNSSTIGIEPAVATYVDGVYYPSPAGSVFSFNNVSRIEVLKGPQGTLFGRNAAGGVINIVTKDPTVAPSLQADIGYGNYSTVSGDLYASAGLNDDVAADISLLYNHQGDGWGKNIVTGKDTYLNNEIAVRSKLLLKPWSRTRITLIGDYDRARNDQGADDAITPGGFGSNFGYGHVGGFFDSNSNVSGYDRQRQGGVSLKIEQDLSWAQFTSISAWRKAEAPSLLELDGTPVSFVQYDYIEKERDITQEFNLQSAAASKIKWILGFFYFDDIARMDPLIETGTAYGLGPAGGFVINSRQNTKSYAGYAQVTAPLFNNSTHITGGLRYTSDEKSLAASRAIVGTNAPLPYSYPAGFPFSVHQPKLTYRVGLDHSFTPDILTYISYSRGFKSGQYNLTSPNQLPTKPEILDAYEIGVKSELFNHVLRANVAGFYYKYHDKQESLFIGTSNVLSNAASADYKGIDAEFTLAPTRNLNFIAGVTYVDAQFLNYQNAVFVNALPGGGVGPAHPGDASGLIPDFVLPLSVSGTAQYTTEQSFGTLSGQVTVTHHSHYFKDAQNLSFLPAYTTLDANLSLTLPSRHFTVTLWGKNLTQEHYFSTRVLQASTGDLFIAAAPRTFGFRLGYKM